MKISQKQYEKIEKYLQKQRGSTQIAVSPIEVLGVLSIKDTDKYLFVFLSTIERLKN